MIDTTYNDLITWAIKTQEGGFVYTDHPSDLGGPTFAGVSYKWFSIWLRKIGEGDGSPETGLENFRELAQMKDVGLIEAIYDFYRDEFINPLQLNRIHTHLYELLFSCAINIDPRDCIKLLQKTLNKLTTIPDTLIIDGLMGNKTELKLQNYIKITSDIDFQEEQCRRLTNNFCHLWMVHYAELVQKVPRQSDNLKGWTNRVFKFVK